MRLNICCALLVWLLPFSAWADDDPEAMARGRELTRSFHAGEMDALWKQMSAPMQGAMKSADGLKAFGAQVAAQLGSEKDLTREEISEESGAKVYQRYSNFDKVPMPILTQWVFDDAGLVLGFVIRPAQAKPPTPAPSEFLERQTLTSLRLPVDQEFFVFWGGRTIDENYHSAHSNQRFASDWVIKRDGSTHAGDGKTNADYYCFGAPILSPADGKVVEVISDVADNVPGVMNPEQLTGNRVVIDHGNGEYSLLAHLKSGSIRVETGDSLKAGEAIGECGNSGNSSEAHLHYQLQDGPTFGDSNALPAQFQNYLADDKPVSRGEPVRGQRIRPTPPNE